MDKELIIKEIKSQLKELSFFNFKTKRAKKDELKSLKQTITVIKSSKHIHNLIQYLHYHN